MIGGTDDDVLQIASMAKEVIKAGREASGRRDIKCTVSIGFVPKLHTPFQWASQLDHESTDARLAKLKDAIALTANTAKRLGFGIDGKPGIEFALARGPTRWPSDRARVAGRRTFRRMGEHFSFDRGWVRAVPPSDEESTSTGSPRARRDRGAAGAPRFRLIATGCGMTGKTRWKRSPSTTGGPAFRLRRLRSMVRTSRSGPRV